MNYLLTPLLLLLLCSSLFCTTLILNSQDYEDVISAAVFAKSNNYSFVFALTPNQSVFLSKYYTLDSNKSILYLEGNRPVLPNMRALLEDSGIKNLNSHAPSNVQAWIADRLDNDLAIIVGKQYGQDALSVSSYAALQSAPIYFVQNAQESSDLISHIVSRGYSQVLIYGPIAEQFTPDQLALLPQRRIINTGNRYSNNLELVSDFIDITKSEQAMFVSGHTFEKSMVDSKYPLILVGRSDIPSDLRDFVKSSNLKTGIVFSGDGDIVEGVNKLRNANPQMSFFVKFGEGYRGSSQPLPLMIISLPSPQISLEIVSLNYNVAEKIFELSLKNTGDYAAVSAGASIPTIGSSQSSQILMDSDSTTTLSIPLDASAVLKNDQIPLVTITIRYGEDTSLMDNIDVIEFSGVETSFYNDTSVIRLADISYSSEQKSFVLLFEGNGWLEGTLGFNINNRPVVLRIPLTYVDEVAKVKIKHLLSSDEEKFVQGISANYFVRLGQREDILIKENRGEKTIKLVSSNPLANFSLGIDSIYIFAIVILLAGALIAFKFLGGDGESFE